MGEIIKTPSTFSPTHNHDCPSRLRIFTKRLPLGAIWKCSCGDYFRLTYKNTYAETGRKWQYMDRCEKRIAGIDE